MRKPLLFTLALSMFFNLALAGNDHVRVVSSDERSIVLEFTLGAYALSAVETPWGVEHKVNADQATPLLVKGAPDLPKYHASVLINDQGNTKVDILSSSYTDLVNTLIAPGKGNFYRNTDPSAVPFEKLEAYSQDKFWPGDLAATRDPYILRDHRGQTILFQPFQYNAVSRTLRVYDKITVKITFEEGTPVNPYVTAKPKALDREFEAIYQDIFLNYGNQNTRSAYPVISEQGRMLIICHSAFMADMAPFVAWKKQQGIPVDLVNVSTIGSTPTDIKAYVDNYYTANGLTYLLLVGDHPQIPAGSTIYGPSDNWYGYLAGNDSYPEVFVGRFSAENSTHVQTQVQRSIEYEKHPQLNATWYKNAAGIASDEGPGDDNEYDYEHIRNLGVELLNFTYSDAHELFEGSQGNPDAPGDPSAGDLANVINAGVSVINYTGHGASNSSSTTGFSNSHISNLNNVGKLPWFWAVACSNGEFTNGTCYAEYWLRSTKNGEPIGAIATLMATILQSWAPPMDGQDEMVAILTESYSNNIKRTFTGISMHGAMKMNDAYGSAGHEMTDTWTTFGDPSVQLRTDAPTPLTAAHTWIKPLGVTSLVVNSNTEDAFVSLTVDGEIIGTGSISGGLANIAFSPINQIDTILVTVTAFNKAPYIGEVLVSGGVGINETAENSIALFPVPTPTNGILTVTPDFSGDGKLTIINAEGKIVKDQRMSFSKGNNIEADLSGISSGSYVLTISCGDAVHNRTFVIR